MKTTQIVYSKDKITGDINQVSRKEADCMRGFGFFTGTEPILGMKRYIYRGPLSKVPNIYQTDLPWLNTIDAFNKTWDMTQYLSLIVPWTFPSVIVPTLDEDNLYKAIKTLNCSRVFIKNGVRSLFFLGEKASVYPDTDLNEIKDNFNNRQLGGPYIIRKFIDNIEIFYNETRYWIFNGKPCIENGIIPKFVVEAAKLISNFSGSKYFTIDVAGDYIIEVNPGESSDRGGNNQLDWFCSNFAKEFLL